MRGVPSCVFNVFNEQKYAATDAHAAVEIFKTLNGHSNLRLKFVSKHSLERDISDCQKYLNLKFNDNIAPSAKPSEKQVDMSTKPVRSYSKTTNMLYTNCFLQAPRRTENCSHR
ncbi:hypothetical protein HA402_010352 [Bradysia odoriphaga]|nr:hypothetical protein HA402_010352 [Bradysia odoriphaga]